MSMFDSHKVLCGLPEPGQIVKYVRPVWSWFTNVEEDTKNLLEPNHEYTVEKTQLNSSSSYVWLKEFPAPADGSRRQPFFSLSSFAWIPPALDLNALVGLQARSCLRLNTTYGVGIIFNDNKSAVMEGDPILSLEYEHPHEIITKAYWKS